MLAVFAAALVATFTFAIHRPQPASAWPIAWHCAALHEALINEFSETGWQNPFWLETYGTYCQ